MLSQLATYMIEEKLMQVKALKASASVAVPSIPVGINITKSDIPLSRILEQRDLANYKTFQLYLISC